MILIKEFASEKVFLNKQTFDIHIFSYDKNGECVNIENIECKTNRWLLLANRYNIKF